MRLPLVTDKVLAPGRGGAGGWASSWLQVTIALATWRPWPLHESGQGGMGTVAELGGGRGRWGFGSLRLHFEPRSAALVLCHWNPALNIAEPLFPHP